MHIEEKDEIYLQYLQKYFKLNEAPFYKKCILILEKYVKKMMFEGNQKSPHKKYFAKIKGKYQKSIYKDNWIDYQKNQNR